MKQIVLEAKSIDDVIDATLELIESELHILYEPRYTEFGYESCFMCSEDFQLKILYQFHGGLFE